jgi:hypothetical protein
MYQAVRSFLKSKLPQNQFSRISKTLKTAKAFYYRNDLPRLASLYFTDKWNIHWYAVHYQHYFQPWRKKKFNLLEIGIGGFADPKAGGESLRMWKAYFRKAIVYGIDIYDKKALEENRIRIEQGSQEDEAFLKRLSEKAGGFDLIIDDGSHVNRHAIKTFQILFPLLRPGGIYVVEDTQSSYWPGFGGSSDDLRREDTIMGYFKGLTDGLNYEERIQPGYAPTYFDRNITGIHFFHNLIFILKGDNNEGSNLLEKNKPLVDWIATDYAKAPEYQPPQP